MASNEQPDTRPMVRLGDDHELQQFIARLNRRAAEVAAAHDARMATLPPGTCALCYGECVINGHPCPECQVVDTRQQSAPGVPYEFHDSTLANYEPHEGNRSAITKAQAFLATRARDLFISGGVGAGKTRLACAIANESHRAQLGGLFVRVPMLLHQLQPGREASEIADLERRVFTAPLLVMDDLGAERDQATDYTRRTLLMIYEERCDRGLRTVFTSNKTLDEIGEMQDDDRLSSRIAGRSDVVKLAMPDQRLARRRKRSR